MASKLGDRKTTAVKVSWHSPDFPYFCLSFLDLNLRLELHKLDSCLRIKKTTGSEAEILFTPSEMCAKSNTKPSFLFRCSLGDESSYFSENKKENVFIHSAALSSP